MDIARFKKQRENNMTDKEILINLWKKVNSCKTIPFSESSYLNENNETMTLLDDLVMISVINGDVVISFSAEMDVPMAFIDVYNFVHEATGIKPVVAESYYIQWLEENGPPEMLFGEEAYMLALKDKCFHVFKDLLQSKNMKDFLEDLDPNEMHKA